MSPETEARMRSWAGRTRAAIEAGAIACPGDGSECVAHAKQFGRHVRDCALAAATAELSRIERELEGAAGEHFCTCHGAQA